MKRIAIFVFALAISIVASAQDIVTINNAKTVYTEAKPILGNNGIYLRPSLGVGLTYPFLSNDETGRNGKHYGVEGGWSLHVRFKEKYWAGMGYCMAPVNVTIGNDIVYHISTPVYLACRANVKTWGKNSLFADVRIGFIPSSWQEEYYTTVVNVDGRAYFALQAGLQIKPKV